LKSKSSGEEKMYKKEKDLKELKAEGIVSMRHRNSGIEVREESFHRES
jgi:hypothetical protein